MYAYSSCKILSKYNQDQFRRKGFSLIFRITNIVISVISNTVTLFSQTLPIYRKLICYRICKTLFSVIHVYSFCCGVINRWFCSIQYAD